MTEFNSWYSLPVKPSGERKKLLASRGEELESMFLYYI